MKILVTGGAGYIGSHTVLALLDAKHEVVILDDLSTGHPSLIDPRAVFYQGDIADENLLNKIFSEHKISAVMHFAAKLIVPESVTHPALYHDNNVRKFKVLLNAAARARIPHFIFSSTAAVYGEGTGEPASEDTPPAPINPYGETKLLAERALTETAAAHHLKYVTLRYFNVAGADGKGRAGQMMPNATHLLKVACEVAVGRRDHMQIFGTDYPTPDGTCIRDYIHVTDLADAHLRALEYLQRGGDSVTLNCGYGHGYSVRDVIAAVNKAVGHPINTIDAPRRAGDPASLIADSQKIRAMLNWKPQHDDLYEIVTSALAWEKTR
jgi:UDP-glucose 4-epimerase